MDVHLSNEMTNCQPLQNIISHCIMYGLRRPNCHHGKMLGSTSFHILWTFKSVFSPCPYGIVVVVFHFDSGGRKAKKTVGGIVLTKFSIHVAVRALLPSHSNDAEYHAMAHSIPQNVVARRSYEHFAENNIQFVQVAHPDCSMARR